MGHDISAVLAVARTAATQQSMQLAMVKKAHEMQMALAQMVAEVARSAPPPGQGTVVDKLA